jgi:hypothetical protein
MMVKYKIVDTYGSTKINFLQITCVLTNENFNEYDFFCVGVVNSGEYDVCDVYSECISTPGELEKYARSRWESNLRSYAVRTVRVSDISEQNLVPNKSSVINSLKEAGCDN